MAKDNFPKSNKCVLLLGAGFSAHCGPPVMRAFMAEARRRYFHHKNAKSDMQKHFEEMLSFHRDCQSSSWLFNRDWDNIEELYTQADLLRLCNPRTSSSQKTCDSIAWSIWDIYRRVNPAPPRLGDIFNDIRSNMDLDPVVITTNYDVLAELGTVVAKNGNVPNVEWQPYYPGFVKSWSDQGKSFLPEDEQPELICDNKSSVPIIKLHGSVNWFENRKSKKWVANTCLTDKQQTNDWPITENNYDHASAETHIRQSLSIKGPLTPGIIPPMIGKSSVAGIIAKQWKAAIECLSRAHQIIVIGYSFPDTDVFMLRLLTEGLKNNSNFGCITIADCRTLSDGWDETIHKFFTPVARSQNVWFAQTTSEHLLSSDNPVSLFLGTIRTPVP